MKFFVLALTLSLAAPAFAKDQKKSESQTDKPLLQAVGNEKYDDIALFGRVINFVEKQYVDPVKTRELIYGAIKGMLESLDPHSNFMPPDIYKQLKSDTSGKFGGFGIEVTANKDGQLVVITPTENTPAWKAGIKPGDKIIQIDGESTKGMSLVEAMSKIRGEPGSSVEFVMERAGVEKPLSFKLKRVIIDIKSVKAEMLKNNYGYAKLNHFQEKTARELKSAIAKLEEKTKLKGLVIDLRNNPGGLLDEAADVVNLFVDNGVIVSTIGRNREEKEVKTAKSGIARLDIPLVILVNGNSASAAEIVAGALKDHRRATIMGSRTFGKGSVQTVIPLADDVGLKLTIARYYTPNGTSIQAKGIEPDIELEEIDADTLAKIREKNEVTREADLKNHFHNEAEERKKEKKALESVDPRHDYQVQQALNYLVGYELMKASVPAPTTQPISKK